MRITFLGATKTVTGSKYLLTINAKNILVDCGLFQGYKELRLRNWDKLPIDPKQIDALVLTHAHIDHTGYIPLLIKNGFKGPIYCTQGTKDLCAILLPDSGYLQEEDAKLANQYHFSKHKPALPLYTREDGVHAISQFHSLPFEQPYQLFDSIALTLKPAGHIIGSSLVKIEYHGKSIVFTGDLGRPVDPIMHPPANIAATDYLVVESTYGDRLHDTTDPLDQLEEVINQTVARGGSIIIPAFAVGRTQDLLYFIYQLKKAGRIPDLPVFLDSPMAENASDLLIRYSGEHQLSQELCKDICQTAKYVRTAEESKDIDKYTTPVIIIAASGMLEGGRILHHLKVFLPDAKNTVLLTGYQSPGTRGDRLQKGETEIKIHGNMVPVAARVALLKNMSAHADYQGILSWLKNLKQAPKKVFITHGDQESSLSLKEKITQTFGWNCIIPDTCKAMSFNSKWQRNTALLSFLVLTEEQSSTQATGLPKSSLIIRAR